MIEGDPQIVPGGAAVPVSGRIGVIVYLAIGDAAAQLEVVGHEVRTVDGNDVPVLEVRNSGNAHGRLQGFVVGRDADGKTSSEEHTSELRSLMRLSYAVIRWN